MTMQIWTVGWCCQANFNYYAYPGRRFLNKKTCPLLIRKIEPNYLWKKTRTFKIQIPHIPENNNNYPVSGNVLTTKT